MGVETEPNFHAATPKTLPEPPMSPERLRQECALRLFAGEFRAESEVLNYDHAAEWAWKLAGEFVKSQENS